MSTKIPTMPNTNWSNSWLLALKISVWLGMRISLFMAGGERICRISWTLRKIIRKLRSSFWKKTIARPRPSYKQLTMWSNIIATVVRRISGPKMKTGKRLSITGLMTSRTKRSLLPKPLKSWVAKRATNTVILRFSTGLMPSHGPLKKRCSSPTFPTRWWGAPSSTAGRKFGMSLLIWTWLPTSVTISVLSALSMNLSGESGQVQWIRFALLPKCKNPRSWMLRPISCSQASKEKQPKPFGTLPISFLIWEKNWTSWPLQNWSKKSLTRRVIWRP